MMNTQPEALLCAEALETNRDMVRRNKRAAAELRRLAPMEEENKRLHEVNGELADKLLAKSDRVIELEILNQEMTRLLFSTVPDEYKSCASPVGAVQSYIADLYELNQNLEIENQQLMQKNTQILRLVFKIQEAVDATIAKATNQ